MEAVRGADMPPAAALARGLHLAAPVEVVGRDRAEVVGEIEAACAEGELLEDPFAPHTEVDGIPDAIDAALAALIGESAAGSDSGHAGLLPG